MIGCRCKHGNVFSRAVLIGREASILNNTSMMETDSSFVLHRLERTDYAGGHSGGATPVPIPNTAVKPSSADGTSRVTFWESRSSPAKKYLRGNPWGPPNPPRGFSPFFVPENTETCFKLILHAKVIISIDDRGYSSGEACGNTPPRRGNEDLPGICTGQSVSGIA